MQKGIFEMICQTIRKGSECAFMTAKGCNYNGGVCHEIVEACQGCGRATQIEAGWYCSACPEPSTKWKRGNCNLATHIAATVAAAKAKVNPLKASKRGMK
jgi:hypothetical protein